MKRKSLTPWLPFSSRLLLCPLPDISLATWNLASLSQHHCIKDMLPMKIYPYLSYRREINETDVTYTCNLQKVWDSSDSLNGNSCSIIFIRSIIPIISGDFLSRRNAITVRKGREKGQFWGISYFWIEVFFEINISDKKSRRFDLSEVIFKCIKVL